MDVDLTLEPDSAALGLSLAKFEAEVVGTICLDKSANF